MNRVRRVSRLWLCAAVVLVATVTASHPDASERDRLLEDPDQFDARWIYLDWSGEDAELAAAAERAVPVAGGSFAGEVVNEFNRASLVATERARLQDLFDARRGVATLVTEIAGTLSDYDPGYGEFYVNVFAPGSSFSFPPHRGHHAARHLPELYVTMELENALDAYVWKVSPEQAARIVATFEGEGNAGYRRVLARTTVALTGTRADSGARRRLIGQVLAYSLRSQDGTLLREVEFER